jgi:hypothetical protein
MTRVSTSAEDFNRGEATVGFAAVFFAMREVCAEILSASTPGLMRFH